jgi:MFS family permease
VAPGIVLFGIGIGLFNPSVSSMVSKTAAANQRGAVMGVYQAASALGRVVGPGVSGLMYSKIGMAAPFALGAAIMLPVIGLLAMARTAAVDQPPATAGQ